MSRILFLYSTVDGHTLKICRRLQQVVEKAGHQVMLADLQNPRGIELESFDTVVVGASIRYAKHQPEVPRQPPTGVEGRAEAGHLHPAQQRFEAKCRGHGPHLVDLAEKRRGVSVGESEIGQPPQLRLRHGPLAQAGLDVRVGLVEDHRVGVF